MIATMTPSRLTPIAARTDASAPVEGRWAAVTARDASQDGRFVYAVSTTGVYCRPSCPSRRPRREHVAFFDTQAGARAAGFRACLRCHPDRPLTPAADAVARARALLDAAADAPPTLAELAEHVGMSAHHLQRTFTRLVGASPRQYAAALRADRLKAELRRRGATVSRATFEAGYGAASRVYEAAGAQLGMTPAAYRHGGRGVSIRYATAPTPLGWVLVAGTARGVCAVTLGDDETALLAALGAEFPAAAIARAGEGPDDAAAATPGDAAAIGAAGVRDADLARWLDAVVTRLGGAPAAEPPLDVAGTAFQQRVWQALREIPAGETRSYAAVAESIGRPTAARAVAAACASNRVAVVIPCHRVVRGTGAMGGYRWGLDRKRALLEAEGGR